MDLDLALGSAGATLSGIAPRLYSRGVRIAIPGEATLSPVSGAPTRYTLRGLPQGVDAGHRLTYEFPAGVYGSARWDTPATPAAVILPFRMAGLEAADLDLVLLRNGAVASLPIPLAVTELGGGSEPGDYSVSGWPATASGERWSLSWSLGGVFGMETWEVPAVAAVGDWREADKAALRDLFAGWVPPGLSPATPTAPGVGVPGIAGGWAGIAAEGERLPAVPVPSGRSTAPTVFAGWRLVYDRVTGLYEPGGNPPRTGKLICSGFVEDGARRGALDTLFAGLAAELDSYSDLPTARLCFNGEDAVPQAAVPLPPWGCSRLVVPFQA